LTALAQSVGGGVIAFRKVGEWTVDLTGKTYDLLVECGEGAVAQVEALAKRGEGSEISTVRAAQGGDALVYSRGPAPMGDETRRQIRSLKGVRHVWSVRPVFYVQRGEALFSSAAEMARRAKSQRTSLGRVALEYESRLLGFSEKEAKEEMLRRWDVMTAAIERGLRGRDLKMSLLKPSASRIFEAGAAGSLALGGPAIGAAARAMAVLHVSSSGGVVCAAPTGASSGVIPGVMATLAETKKLSADRIALALFAASAVGLVIARRATFAAEVAGCQVEIGAAGAMAAAAAVEALGGSADLALDAAAVSLQNSMGSVCDLVQGLCEIPCHTRNAVGATSALVCADLVLGGYVNPVPLDETVDAVFSVGKMLPRELRCTSLGGLAATPSAQSLGQPRRRGKTT
jgi:L-serine dehydratase